MVAFDHGTVSAGRDLELEPRVTLSLDAVDFLRLATGNADPATLFLSGRLGLSGDELFAIEMASFLRIPGADGETTGDQALDPSAVDATRMAAVVRDAPDDALRRGMRGPIRRADPRRDLPPLPRVLQPGTRLRRRRDRLQDHRPRGR